MARITDTLSRERDQFAYELFLQKSGNGNYIYSPKDVNAAPNILRLGLSVQPLAEERPFKSAQEAQR